LKEIKILIVIFKEEAMPVRQIFVIVCSLVTAIYSIIQIYKIALRSLSAMDELLASAVSESPSLLILDPIFWLWTIIAWISSFFLIRNYLILHDSYLSRNASAKL
jgi:hypothetical protein